MKFEPQIDPWELMVEHNQRIQRLEATVKDQNTTIEGLVKIIASNRHTIDCLLKNDRLVLDTIVILLEQQGMPSLLLDQLKQAVKSL